MTSLILVILAAIFEPEPVEEMPFEEPIIEEPIQIVPEEEILPPQAPQEP